MSTLSKSILVARDLGNPRDVLKMDVGVSLPIGRFVGEVTEAVSKRDKQDNVYDELRGKFKGIPTTPYEVTDREANTKVTVDTLVSGRLLLPSSVHQDLVDTIRKAVDGHVVHFAVDLAVTRADTTTGYRWEVTHLFPLTSHENNPFAHIDAKIKSAAKAKAA